MKNTNDLLNSENKKWLEDFASEHGRPLRILHISNIANNAYNNANLLNQCMTINHVVAANDRYAMSCPEWEDADYDEDVDDMWNPPWSEFNLNGFERPAWFVQGSYEDCYIKLHEQLCRLSIRGTISLYIQPIFKYLKEAIDTILLRQIRRALRLSKKILNLSASRTSVINTSTGSANPDVVKLGLSTSKNGSQNDIFGQWDSDEILVSDFLKEFPEREDKLTLSDFRNYYFSRPHLSKLMEYYDIVIGYAVEGVYPLMSSKPYIAFEHGTIRHIPYEKDTQGRLCALVYRKADHVLVTNSDCKNSAQFLAPGKYTLINHPYDEDHGMNVGGYENLRANLNLKLDSEFLFFFPTRHDWVEGTGYADKGNDIFLKAFGRLRQQGYKVGLICCEWGKNINESKALLDELGCGQHVMWVKPMPVVRFERMSKAADLVVDQFMLGAFGGVMFKAMSAGAAVLTYLDVERVRGQYQVEPPVINCKTEEDIYSNVVEIISSPQMLLKLKSDSRAWIKKFHGKASLVNAEIAVFRQILSRNHLTQH